MKQGITRKIRLSAGPAARCSRGRGSTPRGMLKLHDAWDQGTEIHPGVAIIGGDGSREQLVLDLRTDPAPVLLVDITSSRWDSAIRQAHRGGNFTFNFED